MSSGVVRNRSLLGLVSEERDGEEVVEEETDEDTDSREVSTSLLSSSMVDTQSSDCVEYQ